MKESENWCDIASDLIYDQKQYEQAISLCERYLDGEDKLQTALARYWMAVSYYYIASSIDSITERAETYEIALNNIDYCVDVFGYDEYDEDEVINTMFDMSLYMKTCILGLGPTIFEKQKARRLCIFLMGYESKAIDSVRSEIVELYSEITEDLFNYYNEFLTIDEFNEECRQEMEEQKCSPKKIQETLEFNLKHAEKAKFSNTYTLGERQFIFIVQNINKIAGCYDNNEMINWVFTINKVPGDLLFPIGHPQANTLYIAHPARKGFYLPYERAEEILFHEKVEEFCRLAQCLGACKISFKSLKGENISEGLSSAVNINGGVDYSVIAATGGYSQKQTISAQSESKREVGYSYVFKPNTKPYVPKDLIWLETDQSWQNFIKQRLEGNILSYTKRITSQETINVSRSLSLGVRASFQYLMAKVDGNYDENTDSTFSSNQNTEWESSIEFEPIERIMSTECGNVGQSALQKLSKTKSSPLTKEEDQYREEVLFILEDGTIAETERKFLERKRVKLGLTPERAAEIEAMCTPSLTEAEKEYIELFKEIAADGPITERKRKILSREADSLGIDLERIKEIEDLALS